MDFDYRDLYYLVDSMVGLGFDYNSQHNLD
jgi:hypothetical protein